MGIQINPVRRNWKFGLPKDQITRWNQGNLHLTQFFNTLSLFFPVGERFFIHTLRHYRDQISDERLQAQIAAFIAQEAFHGREHDEHNAAMREAGLPAARMEQVITQVLEWAKRLPPSAQLAGTVSLEHLTALLGDILLREPRLLENAEPHFKALWQWHALEETEHKAVAFDTYCQVVGTGPKAYALRVGIFLFANSVFWSLFYPFYFQTVKASGGHRDIRGWIDVFRTQFVDPGALRRILPGWLDFFRPDFHPWQHDNRHLLARLDSLLQELEVAPAR